MPILTERHFSISLPIPLALLLAPDFQSYPYIRAEDGESRFSREHKNSPRDSRWTGITWPILVANRPPAGTEGISVTKQTSRRNQRSK